MNLTPAQASAAQREFTDFLKRQRGMSGVEYQADKTLVLTNDMPPEAKAAVRAKQEQLSVIKPVEFYEMGPIKAQASGAG